MSASKLTTQINNYLKSKGYYSFTTISSSKRGVPDIIACSPQGRFTAIEVKYGNDKLSAIQNITLATLDKLQANVIVARSLDDVKEWV